VIALIAAAMRDLMPSTAALPGIENTDIAGFLSRMRREADRAYWLGLVVGTIVYNLTPLLTVYVPLPAVLLPARLRDLHARRIVESKSYVIRQAVFLVRLSAGMCWGGDPAVRARFDLAPYGDDPGTFRTS
jgi:hypothetical protein